MRPTMDWRVDRDLARRQGVSLSTSKPWRLDKGAMSPSNCVLHHIDVMQQEET